MKYLRPRLPEKEIELCLDLFDKQEAKKRILKYIEGVLDDAESQFKNCFIHDAVKEQDSAIKMGWTNTLIDMPLCYEIGVWIGKRSDEVLVEDDEGRRYVARMYSGQMDGSYFADWISNDGYIINKEIVRWLKIPA